MLTLGLNLMELAKQLPSRVGWLALAVAEHKYQAPAALAEKIRQLDSSLKTEVLITDPIQLAKTYSRCARLQIGLANGYRGKDGKLELELIKGALVNLQSALAIEEVGEKQDPSAYDPGDSYWLIKTAYKLGCLDIHSLNPDEKTISFLTDQLEKARPIWEQKGQTVLLAKALNLIGSIYFLAKQTEKYDAYLTDARQIALEKKKTVLAAVLSFFRADYLAKTAPRRLEGDEISRTAQNEALSLYQQAIDEYLGACRLLLDWAKDSPPNRPDKSRKAGLALAERYLNFVLKVQTSKQILAETMRIDDPLSGENMCAVSQLYQELAKHLENMGDLKEAFYKYDKAADNWHKGLAYFPLPNKGNLYYLDKAYSKKLMAAYQNKAFCHDRLIALAGQPAVGKPEHIRSHLGYRNHSLFIVAEISETLGNEKQSYQLYQEAAARYLAGLECYPDPTGYEKSRAYEFGNLGQIYQRLSWLSREDPDEALNHRNNSLYYFRESLTLFLELYDRTDQAPILRRLTTSIQINSDRICSLLYQTIKEEIFKNRLLSYFGQLQPIHNLLARQSDLVTVVAWTDLGRAYVTLGKRLRDLNLRLPSNIFIQGEDCLLRAAQKLEAKGKPRRKHSGQATSEQAYCWAGKARFYKGEHDKTLDDFEAAIGHHKKAICLLEQEHGPIGSLADNNSCLAQSYFWAGWWLKRKQGLAYQDDLKSAQRHFEISLGLIEQILANDARLEDKKPLWEEKRSWVEKQINIIQGLTSGAGGSPV